MRAVELSESSSEEAALPRPLLLLAAAAGAAVVLADAVSNAASHIWHRVRLLGFIKVHALHDRPLLAIRLLPTAAGTTNNEDDDEEDDEAGGACVAPLGARQTLHMVESLSFSSVQHAQYHAMTKQIEEAICACP